MIWSSSKNYSKSVILDTKSRQQCQVRDQEYIIIVSTICELLLLRFETSALPRYKCNKRAYPLRFVTSWILQTVSFPVHFQWRFRQGPHQTLKKNNNYQVLVHKCICIHCTYVSQPVLFVSFDLALFQYATFGFSILKTFESLPCCWLSMCNLHIYTSARNTICTQGWGWGFQRTTECEVVPSSGKKSNTFTGHWSKEQTVRGRNQIKNWPAKTESEIDQQSCDWLFFRRLQDPRSKILK